MIIVVRCYPLHCWLFGVCRPQILGCFYRLTIPQDERRPDVQNTPSNDQDPHCCGSRQLAFLIFPLPSRHTRHRPQKVPDLGRRRDVLHRAGTIRRRHRHRRHRLLVLEEGCRGRAVFPQLPDRDRARRLLVCQTHRRHWERWQGCAEGDGRGREPGRHPHLGPHHRSRRV